MDTTSFPISQERVIKGQAVYTEDILSEYDKIVVGFSARFLWKCSARRLLNFYNKNISDCHLDVGVGSGYYLDKCRFPSKQPKIALLDLNASSLDFTSKRIERYKPSCYQASVLEPLSLEPNQFDSVGINYLLHCLPGTLATKTVAFQHLKPLMKDGAILFGSTILGQGVNHHYLGKIVMHIYNSTGVFSNWHDSVEDLKQALASNFSSYSVQVVGCTALFTARK
ncbi:class I SAM-dependent methyltransferase [Microcoleus sp. herbarium8]|uniref:class I SAM-dependent methyltransferase n=1 Tax=Microcoleus sp. herbarium8 TaxID=3055436 RepID=UPI002FD6E3C2